jgi:NAD(P)-dependent dehydrogenase (short-subunit alcohol dehydrogenase family)
MTTILITGANRGIGLALAEAAVKRGDRVIATMRDPFKLPDLLKTAPKEQMVVIGMDVTDQKAIVRAATSLREPIDMLINNAGISGHRSSGTIDMDLDDFLQVLRVNTLAPLAISRAFLPHLEQSKRPRILTISTQMAALTGSGYLVASDRMSYRASKTAVNKIMQGLAIDLKPKGIPVALVHPGWVRTDMGGGAADLSPEESANGILALGDGLTIEKTGGFFRWDGSVHPW